ncbi:MAG: PIG-L deacetylase family protein [Thermodesulfobacteriota bacterium]
MRVLIVAAHPDDEVLGCGGTIAKHAFDGDDVFIVILGEGMMARSKSENDPHLRRKQRKLWEFSKKAARILGAHQPVQHHFPDNRLDQVDLLEIVHAIEDSVERFNPDMVYTHHPGDLNVDHTVVARASATATRPLPGRRVAGVYSFEVLSSTEWAFGVGGAFQANRFVNITKFLELKIQAIQAYETEVVAFPHPRSIESITALAKLRGSQSGLGLAEGFSVVRELVG